MARHLIVGDGTAYGVTNGLVDDGAVSVQKMSSSGPTELVLGDTPANAPQIRIIGGGSDGKDIVTPWIYGKDVINWSGKSYTAAAAHTSLITPTTTSAAAAKVGGDPAPAEVRTWPELPVDTAAGTPLASYVIRLPSVPSAIIESGNFVKLIYLLPNLS